MDRVREGGEMEIMEISDDYSSIWIFQISDLDLGFVAAGLFGCVRTVASWYQVPYGIRYRY
jgi:hypothetical protein